MSDSVTQTQYLIGARLRDPRHSRLGRVVGIDQTRDTPALLIVWEGQRHAERVPLSTQELRDLVTACIASRPVPAALRARDAGTVAGVDPEQMRIMHVGR